MRRRLLVCLAASVAASCFGLPPIALRPEGEPRHLNFHSNEGYCSDRSEHSPGTRVQVSTHLSVSAPPEDTIRRLMCTPHPRGELYEVLYRRFEPRDVTPLVGAMMVVTCVGEGRCDPEGGRPSFGLFASILPYTAFEPEQVERSLAGVPLRPEVRDAFVLRYIACRAHMIESARAMDPRMRAVFVDTVATTLRRRAESEERLAAHHRAYASMRPRIDAALVTGPVTAELRDEVQGLRDTYAQACLATGREPAYCLGGPVARPLTDALVRLSIALGDAPVAHAEARVLETWPDVTDARCEIRVAVGDAMREETERYREHQRALAAGVDRATAARLLGGAPPADLSDYRNVAGREPPAAPRFGSELARLPQVERIRQTIGPIQIRRDEATVHFRAESRHRRAAPVLVPSSETRHLAPGLFVEVVADRETRRGVVSRVYESPEEATLLQVRGLWIGSS